MAEEIRQEAGEGTAEKLIAILSLARRAGAVELGYDASARACLRGRARLLVLASDLGGTARRRAENLAQECGVERLELGDKETLGKALGYRDIGVVAVCDPHFARGLTGKPKRRS